MGNNSEFNLLIKNLKSNIMDFIRKGELQTAEIFIEKGINIVNSLNTFDPGLFFLKIRLEIMNNKIDIAIKDMNLVLEDYCNMSTIDRDYAFFLEKIILEVVNVMEVKNENILNILLFYCMLKSFSTSNENIESYDIKIESLRKTLDLKLRKTKRERIFILDKNSPDITSGFSVAEFNYYFQRLNNCYLYSESHNFDVKSCEYIHKFPFTQGRFIKFSFYDLITELKGIDDFLSCSLIYTLFLERAYRYLPIMELLNIPFVFTLYSSLGYVPGDSDSDFRLKKVCESRMMKKVIVCSKYDYKYINENIGIPKEKIEYIYGVVTQEDYWSENKKDKNYYKKDKETFDICFIAHRYTPRGENKGYPIFIEVAKRLSNYSKDIQFHVVGGFTKEDIDVIDLKEKIHFYGKKEQSFFPEFYSNMDILLNLEQNCSFDKRKVFMSASAAQSGLNEVAVFTFDESNINTEFTDGKDIVILQKDIDKIIERILFYYNDLNELYNLSNSCMKKFKQVYGLETQMKPRFNLIKNYSINEIK